MKRPFRIAILVMTWWLGTGCSRQTPPPSGAAPAPGGARLQGLPVEITVKQRSTTVVPGSGGAVSLTVDDITRGQVMVSLTNRDGGVLLGQTSLTTGGATLFRLEGEAYELKLKALNNALIGEDFATLTISHGTEALTESAKIERLLQHIGSMEGATFLRNGSEYTAADAASHLRGKWEAADGNETMTAAEFIDNIARRSSLSDKPYQIRLKDGTEVAAGDYLRKVLEEQK